MSKPIRVLYISYDGMTDSLGQSQVIPYIEGLSKRGFSFHLMSFEKEDRFEANKKMIAERCEKSNITWIPLSYTKKPPVLSTIKDIRTALKTAKKYHEQVGFEIIHCRSYISAFVGHAFQKKYGTKFVFDMRGFWADERVDGRIWNLKNPLFKMVYSYFKKKEKAFLQAADYVVSLTENGANEIRSWDYIDADTFKIKVIPCCVDVDLFNPEAINPHRLRELNRALGITPTDFILGYVGSIGTWYMLDDMLAFFKVFSENNPNAKFLFVTGENPEMIKNKATELGINIEKLLFASTVHKYVPLHIALFDYSLFFIQAAYSKKASSPTKQGEIMAMGVPVLCNAGVGDTDYIVHKYESGQVLTELTEAAFAKVNLDATAFDKNKLRKGAIAFFGLENGVSRFEEVYRYVLKK